MHSRRIVVCAVARAVLMVRSAGATDYPVKMQETVMMQRRPDLHGGSTPARPGRRRYGEPNTPPPSTNADKAKAKKKPSVWVDQPQEGQRRGIERYFQPTLNNPSKSQGVKAGSGN